MKLPRDCAFRNTLGPLKAIALSRRSVMLGLSSSIVLANSKVSFGQELRKGALITIVVPFAAGGSADVMARIICQRMAGLLGVNVVFENRGGAGGTLAATAVARANADGLTLLWGSIATHAINPALTQSLKYDPVRDFSPVSLLVTLPNVLLVNSNVPAKDIGEFIALLKANPGKYSYASSGNGTPLHLSGELFRMMSGTDIRHVPYRGAGPAMNDVVAGHVPVMFDTLASATPHIEAGTVRALAVTTKDRSPTLPTVPTMIEAGLVGYETYAWQGLFAPPNTPEAVIAQLNQAVNGALADPSTADRLRALGATMVGSTPEQLEEHVKAELIKWAPVVKASGAQLE
nr:tripartite tricarboxylate transporter substrate binding protein [Microvirga zambiensis]